MRIYLMRHATAEEAGRSGDASRQLTEQGRRDARQAAEALREKQVTIETILSSPRARARETAEIVGAVLGVKVSIREGLNCGASAEAYRQEIGEGDVLIVGHNPEISAIAGRLASQAVGFRPATVACIEDDQLVWIRHPSQE